MCKDNFKAPKQAEGWGLTSPTSSLLSYRDIDREWKFLSSPWRSHSFTTELDYVSCFLIYSKNMTDVPVTIIYTCCIRNGSHGCCWGFFSCGMVAQEPKHNNMLWVTAPGSQVTACVELSMWVPSQFFGFLHLPKNIPWDDLATLNWSRVKSCLMPSIPAIGFGSTRTQPKQLLKLRHASFS